MAERLQLEIRKSKLRDEFTNTPFIGCILQESCPVKALCPVVKPDIIRIFNVHMKEFGQMDILSDAQLEKKLAELDDSLSHMKMITSECPIKVAVIDKTIFYK